MVTPYPWGLRGSEFEHYLEQFVIYLLQLGLEALEVLWADRLEAGSLHYLLEQFTKKNRSGRYWPPSPPGSRMQ